MTDIRGPNRVPLAVWFAGVMLTGCSGAISAPGDPSPGVGVPGPVPGGAATLFVDRSPALVRLTNAEYSQTLTDLLGEPPDAAGRYRFPDDPRKGGFDNHVDLLKISAGHAERYVAAADAIARATFASPERRGLVVPCALAQGGACVRTFVQKLGRLMYRRPLSEDEVSSFVTLATKVSTPTDLDAGARAALEAMLQSPNFLFRVQVGGPVARRPDLVALGGYEIATRLSYLLTGAAPDAALLDRVQEGALDTPDGIEVVAWQILGGQKACRGTRRFYGQWLPLMQLAGPAADPSRFPRGDAALATDMVEETGRFVDSVLLEGGDVLDLLTGRYTFVNAALAQVYGVAAPATGWARVDFAESVPRAGLLTQGSLLSATAVGGKPSSTQRGQLVREAFLCGEIPSPPPGVANVPPEANAGESEQETFARHTTDPKCSVCHNLMDPIGWGLAKFDAAGAYREVDSNAQPILTKGTVVGLPSPDFDGARELARKVGESQLFKTCFSTQLFRHVFGRHETDEDRAGIQLLEAGFQAAGWDYKGGVAALIRSDGFRFRTKGDAP